RAPCRGQRCDNRISAQPPQVRERSLEAASGRFHEVAFCAGFLRRRWEGGCHRRSTAAILIGTYRRLIRHQMARPERNDARSLNALSPRLTTSVASRTAAGTISCRGKPEKRASGQAAGGLRGRNG